MPGWVAEPGACFLRPSGPGSHLHLFVVVHGPQALEGYGPIGQVLLVSVTTLRPNIPSDPACELRQGDHPFLQHESFAFYRGACLETSDHVEAMVNQGIWPERAACSPAVLARLRGGLLTSELVPRRLKRLF
jgi:hypothetical protein